MPSGRAWLHSVQPHSWLATVLVEMCGSFGGAGLCQSNGVLCALASNCRLIPLVIDASRLACAGMVPLVVPFLLLPFAGSRRTS
ncbi:hypothetical protein GBA52_018106 [Prunus armeniaca]|nr:hypothetical protein GBA52_018106 [Prunus armeniaca]